MATTVLSRDVVRELAVYKQGLHQRPPQPDKPTLKAIIERIGLLQLDSISVTARSHYLVMLARAGVYDRANLDALLPERFLFEQWAHAACLIPMADFSYFLPRIEQAKELDYSSWFKRMGDDPEALLQAVQDEIRAQGPLCSQDFDAPRKGKGGWWNRKPAKFALEYLFDIGMLMANHREHFRRYYELSERVLDGIEYDDSLTYDDHLYWATLRGLHHLGIGTAKHIADYYRLKQRDVRQALDTAYDQGLVDRVQVSEWKDEAYLLHEDAPLVEALESGAHRPTLTVFLSPFDNLIWHRDRVKDVFDFFYRIEVYTPKDKRQYGYYVMPILHHGQLVGRIDPKIDRKERRFLIHALHLEEKTTVDDALVNGLRSTIREFMAFHDCDSVTIDRCDDHPALKDALLASL